MIDETGKVEELKRCNENYFLLTLNCPVIAERAQPGNFVMLDTAVNRTPLLRRPFGLMNALPPTIQIYFEVVGPGTQRMSRLHPGDQLKVLGPLGNACPDLSANKILLVAGGRGIAPLFFAAKRYSKYRDNQLALLYGARSQNDLNLRTEIESLSLDNVYYYTEDGSFGSRGLLTDNLAEIISEHHIDTTVSCGPEMMFYHLNSMFKSGNTTDYFSMEALMGCGFAICHSCVVPGKSKTYLNVCSNGPIFLREEIKWPT